MKTMKNILLFILPLLALLSCSEQMERDIPADNKLSTTISVILPQIPDAQPQTRAMGKTAQIKNLYLAVFDYTGLLKEYVEATPVTETASNIYSYNVTLKPTNTATIIHFIANAPSMDIAFGNEVEVMSSLYTEGGEEAYWQRIVLQNGITSSTTLPSVHLIRNFAWINVQSSAPNFTIQSYCVVNTRKRGSVAPYNTNKDGFVEFLRSVVDNNTTDGTDTDNNVLGKDYAAITGSGQGQDGYNGFIPSGTEINKDIPTTWFEVGSETKNEYAYFVYEREKALSDPPYILVKGTYDPDINTDDDEMTDRFYKIDLRKANGEYFPIVRNFRYRIDIKGVGHSGYGSAQDAANGAGSGDVSSALETQSFNNISNGEARLFVSYTDTTIVDYKPDETYKLRYKYIVFQTSGTTVTEVNKTSTATVATTGNVIPTDGYSIAPGRDEWDGWYEITYKTTELPTGEQPKRQEFVIVGTDANNNSLQRKVNVSLRKKYSMQVECDPIEIPAAMGKPFDVIVKVPGGLGRSMFPLDIQLEAANQSMTPNLGDNLPTVTGPSIVPDKNKTTIGFIKQINWVEYEEYFTENLGAAFMPARCHFKSNKSNTAGSSTTIYASNKYFNQTNAPLSYFDAAQFTDLKILNKDGNETLPTSKDQDVTFTFNMSKLPSEVKDNNGTVTVALCNLMPAKNENKLKQEPESVDIEKGIAYYSFTPESKTVELKLKNTDVNVEAKVMLSSYHFENAERAMNYRKGTFDILSFTPANKYLSKDTEVTFKFSLSRQVKQGRYITVTLGNLVPADTDLTLINEKDGTYRLVPTDMAANTEIELKLKVKNAYQTVSAKLSADYFTDNSVSKAPQKGTFSGLKLEPNGDPTLAAGSVVTFSFTMDDMPSGDVKVTLTNLEPTGTTRATFNDRVYTFKPESKNVELTFKVIEGGNTVSAALSADYFEIVEPVSLDPWTDKVIPKEHIVIGRSYGNVPNNQEIEFTIYTTNKDYKDSNNIIGTFRAKRNGNSDKDITINYTQYNALTNGNIYVRFYNENQKKYYVAVVSLNKLLNEVQTLTFNNQ